MAESQVDLIAEVGYICMNKLLKFILRVCCFLLSVINGFSNSGKKLLGALSHHYPNNVEETC